MFYRAELATASTVGETSRNNEIVVEKVLGSSYSKLTNNNAVDGYGPVRLA